MEITLTRANPEGNITLFVEGSVLKKEYVPLGKKLLQLPGFEAEQVGFVTQPILGGTGRLEMMGGEFCGNAARSFGYLLAERLAITKGTVPVEISGYDRVLPVQVDRTNGTAFISMSPPQEIRWVTFKALGRRPVVCFEGIQHVILENIVPDKELVDQVRTEVYQKETPEALGILFLKQGGSEMIPIVYVHAPDTLCFEQSCGSGSVAAAAWLASNTGRRHFSIKQPGGTLIVNITQTKEAYESYEMGGGVVLEPPRTIALDPIR